MDSGPAGAHGARKPAGGIYVMTNSAMPEAVWIGCADNVEKRLESLNRSQDVPVPLQAQFRLFGFFRTDVRMPFSAVQAFISDIVKPENRIPADWSGKARGMPEALRLAPEGACDILKAFAAVKGLSLQLETCGGKPSADPEMTACVLANPAVPGFVWISICTGGEDEALEQARVETGLPLPWHVCRTCAVPESLDEDVFRRIAACAAPEASGEGSGRYYRLSPEQAAGMLKAAADLCRMAAAMKAGERKPQKPKPPRDMDALMESVLLGLAAGEAFCLPASYRSKGAFKASGMQDGGQYGQQAGTWAGGTSLALALADSLEPGGFDAEKAGRNFQSWLFEGAFSARGEVFDAGGAAKAAIARMREGVQPVQAGGASEIDNDGSCLARTAPMALALLDVPEPEARYEAVRKASSLTHAHPLSCACCFVFEEYLRLEAEGRGAQEGYGELCAQFRDGMAFIGAPVRERLRRVLDGALASLSRKQIESSGFVVHELEAALWCVLKSKGFAEAIARAAGLGERADMTGAAAGAAAGICWGREAVPARWTEQMAGMGTLRRIARGASLQLSAGGPGASEEDSMQKDAGPAPQAG